jgi:hypothetical protein
VEYRILYRDLPWSVALGVLPGKIIGTFIFKPIERLRFNWKQRLRRFFIKLLWASIILSLTICFGLLINELTDGAFFGWILHLKNSLLDIGTETAIQDGNIP